MTLALLIALLSNDSFTAREYAERALRKHSYDTLREAHHASTCPEARARLYRLSARALAFAVDRLLPDERPFWPDRDYLRNYAPVEYRAVLEGTPPGVGSVSRFLPTAYEAYRYRAKAFIVWYVRETGDWCGAEHMLHQAAEDEESLSSNVPALQRDRTFWSLWFAAPELLKGNWR